MTQPRPAERELPRGARALPLPPGGVTGLVMAGDCRLMGWSFVEATGAAPASVDLIDGGQGSSNLLGLVSLTAGQAVTKWLAGHGLQVVSCLGVVVNSGTVRGVLYVIDN